MRSILKKVTSLVTNYHLPTTKRYKRMKVQQEFSTEEIIRAIRTNQRVNEALQYLYQSHYRYLERYILQNSGNEDDAADIIQESFLIFIQMIENDKFRQESSIKSYLYAIIRNLWISELRKRKSMALRGENFSKEKDITELDISTSIVRQESHKLIMSVFAELGEKCKQILYKFYYEDMSMKEIMETEDFSSEQVLRNKKHKCLKRLIDKIQSDSNQYQTIKNALQHVG